MNCFAYRPETDDCRCFEVMLCKYKECPMQKTAEQYAYEAASARIRNRKLGIKRPEYGKTGG